MIAYITHVSILIALGYLFYAVLLARETYFSLNRWILIIGLLGAFLIPLIKVPTQWSFRMEPTKIVQTQNHSKKLPAVEKELKTPEQETVVAAPTEDLNTKASTVQNWNIPRLLWYIYLCGLGIFALNYLLQFVLLLFKMYRLPALKDRSIRIVELNKEQAPFSFLNSIFIHPQSYDWNTYNLILEHEKVHVRQRHSFDIFLGELMLVAQWFNPFAWLYRKAIDNNLEYLADNSILQKGIDAADYQMSLLKVGIPQQPLSPTTNYNHSTIKKRIIMMNARKSSARSFWKYLSILPILGLSMLTLNETFDGEARSLAEETTTTSTKFGWSDEPVKGIWSGDIEANGQVCISFDHTEKEHGWFWKRRSCFAKSEFDKLPTQDDNFKLQREAGTILFKGKFEDNEGLGRYTFEPSSSFKQFLTSKNYDDLSDELLFHMTLTNINKDYFDYMAKEGFKDISQDELEDLAVHMISKERLQKSLPAYRKLDDGKLEIEDLVELTIHDVSPEYIEEMKQLGFKDLDGEEIVEAKIHGVNTEFVAEMQKLGFKDLDLEELQEAAIHGIDAEYVAELKQSGFDDLDVDEVVEAKIHGVDAEFAAKMKAMGFKDLDLEDLQEAAIHGISADYVEELRASGYTDLDMEEIVEAKIHGVSAEMAAKVKAMGFEDLDLEELSEAAIHDIDPAYIEELRAIGFSDLDLEEVVEAKIHGVTAELAAEIKAMGFKDLDLEELSEVAIHEVDPAFVKELQSLGFSDLDLEEVVEAKIHGIDADYAKSLSEMGFEDLELEELADAKIHGVNKEYIEAIRKAGYKDASLEDISDCKIHGVTTEFIQEVRSAGYNNLSLEDLVELKIHNITMDFMKKMEKKKGRKLSVEELVDYKIHERYMEE